MLTTQPATWKIIVTEPVFLKESLEIIELQDDLKMYMNS